MGALTVWRKQAGSFRRRSRPATSDIRDPVSFGDSKRAAVPRDRG